MRRGTAVVVMALLATAVAAGAERGASRTTPPVGVLVAEERHTPDLAEAVRLGIEEGNALRGAAGSKPLAISPELTRAATAFASFSAASDVLDHRADGSHPASRAERAGYDPCIIAENLAYQYLSTGFSTQDLVESLMAGWMDSAGHRANLLEPDVTETGFGIARSSRTGRYYAVQMFGRPRLLKADFVLRNATRIDLRYAIDAEFLPLPTGTTVTHQRCRPVRLTFDWPGAQPATTLEARSGLLYSVVRSEGGLFSVEERPAPSGAP